MKSIRYLNDLFITQKTNEILVKLLTSISIFCLTVFFTPNFNILSFPILILSSITIILFESLTNTIIDTDESIFAKGMIGFTFATIIIYITQFLVEGYYISITSTIIAAGIYGIISSMYK